MAKTNDFPLAINADIRDLIFIYCCPIKPTSHVFDSVSCCK